ncbi:MAG: Transcriptional regulator, HxlR family [Enhydrobacter sp.]|jgi:DNA-binding HxlR family transcriptional regulator|nr:MAG: Transcriptional regulator, HxlR family [Enhydrobacter sp.]
MIDLDVVRTDPAAAKLVQAAFRRAVGMISGRWKLEILWHLNQGTHRFGELKRALPGITQHMLTAQLRALEKDGLIKRTIYAEVPPRVEYEITPAARRLRPIFVEIVKWAEEHEQPAPRDSGQP